MKNNSGEILLLWDGKVGFFFIHGGPNVMGQNSLLDFSPKVNLFSIIS